MSSSTNTQQIRLDRANSTSSVSSSDSVDGWLVLNGHSRSSSTVSTPSITDNSYNPYLQLSPITREGTVAPKFRPTENAEERQRLFLLRARDN